jgi:hypothetical protein
MWPNQRSQPPARGHTTAAVVVISAPDGCAHAVPEKIAATATDGRYLTCCSRTVVSTALVDQPGNPCPLCFPAIPPAAPRHNPMNRRLRRLHLRRPADRVPRGEATVLRVAGGLGVS